MVEIICKYCGEKVETKRRSRLICFKRGCLNKYNNDKKREHYKRNPDKYDEHQFKVSQKNKKMSLLKWNQINREINNTVSIHIDMRNHICDNCGTEFIAGGGINYTPWYAAVCPECGLVERSIIDTDPWEYYRKFQPHPAIQEEINEVRQELRKVKHYPILKKLAIYIDIQKTIIDFPQELIELRKLLNRLKDRNDRKQLSMTTTPEEEQICFKALNEKILKNKSIINK